MFNKPIEEMDFKELRSAVLLIYDAFEKHRRELADLLENLGMDNFSGVFKKELDGMLASVSITEEGIQTMVSKANEYTDEKLKEYSTTTQTADRITSEVGVLRGEVANTYSTKDQTAYEISAAVTSVNENNGERDERISELEQTANKIEASVESAKTSASIAESNSSQALQTSDMIRTVVSKQTEIRDAETVTDETGMVDEDKIYRVFDEKIGDTFYYYDSKNEKWTPFLCNSMFSVFEQTAEGFILKGNVSIDGDLIGGTVSGVTVTTTTDGIGDEVRLNSDNDSLELTYGNDNVIGRWSVKDGGATSLAAINNAILYAEGKWIFTGGVDFFYASVSGLGVVPVFGE